MGFALVLLLALGASEAPSEDAEARGTGRIVAGAIVSGLGLVARGAVMGLTHPVDVAHDPDRSPDPFVGAWAIAAGVSTATVATGLSVLGSGLAARGRFEASQDRRAGLRFDQRRREIAGWTLFTVGVLSFVSTRFGGQACADASGPTLSPDHQGPDPERVALRCALRVLDAAYYPSLALVSIGVALGPRASAYRRARGAPGGVTVRVVATSGAAGFTLAGQF